MKLSELVQKCINDSPVNIHRRDITAKILKRMDIPGHFLEIGGDHGDNTVVLLSIARAQNKTVHVIDPWTIIEHDFDDLPAHTDVYQEHFIKKVAKYSNIKTYRCNSTSLESIEAISKMDLCFAFLDGGYLDWPRVTTVDAPTRNSGSRYGGHRFRVASDRLVEDFRNTSKQFNGPGIISISNVETSSPLWNREPGSKLFPEREGPIINTIHKHMVSNMWELVDVPNIYSNIFLVKDK